MYLLLICSPKGYIYHYPKNKLIAAILYRNHTNRLITYCCSLNCCTAKTAAIVHLMTATIHNYSTIEAHRSRSYVGHNIVGSFNPTQPQKNYMVGS